MTLAMSTITIQQKPGSVGFVFSIGIAVNLVELERAMKEFAEQLWVVDGSEDQDCGEKAIPVPGE